MEILLQGLRVAFAFCLYFLTLACYLAPILVAKCWGSRTLSITSPDRAMRSRSLGLRVIGYCNCFAAGIFLAMCFLTLIPYANEKFQLMLANHDTRMEFPVAECVVVMGFLFTLFAEQIVISCREQRDAFPQRYDIEQGQGLLDECEMQDMSDDPSAVAQDENGESFVGESATANQPMNYAQENPLSTTATTVLSNDMEVAHACSHISLMARRENGFLLYILVLASALHSVFEGIALGLQTDVAKAVHLFIAIIFHECLMSGALGVCSMRLHYSFTSYLKFASIFSSSIPIGLIIGIIVIKLPDTGGDLTSAIVQGLVAGVFLHVVFQDFLPTQFLNREHRIRKVFFISLGFLSITVVTYFVSEI